MEFISKTTVSDVSGCVEISKTPRKKCLVATEGTLTSTETVTCENDNIIIEKDTIVQQSLVIKEKIIVPKEQCSSNLGSPSTFVSNGNDELKATQYSQGSLMDLGSQESSECLKMEVCSQESVVSSMELGSQDINQDSSFDQENVINQCSSGDLSTKLCGKAVSLQNNLKRKLAVSPTENESPKKLCTQDMKTCTPKNVDFWNKWILSEK